jgi:hypothetical protein
MPRFVAGSPRLRLGFSAEGLPSIVRVNLPARAPRETPRTEKQGGQL